MMMRAILLFVVLMPTAGAAEHVHASTETHDAHQQRPAVIVRCTTGSFIDQFAVINSLLIALRDQQSVRAKAELHSVLVLAIKRAALESDCMAPQQMPDDYRDSYRKMMRRALDYLQAQKMDALSKAHGEKVMRYLSGEAADH